MPRLHKTMKGKEVNMDQLRIKHEKTIAVGNLNVNAGGDLIGPGGKIIKDRNQRVNDQKAIHQMQPSKVPVSASKNAADKREQLEKDKAEAKALADKILADADIPVVDAGKTPKGGLAAALAEKDDNSTGKK